MNFSKRKSVVTVSILVVFHVRSHSGVKNTVYDTTSSYFNSYVSVEGDTKAPPEISCLKNNIIT